MFTCLPRLCFAHIPKCSGTSVTSFFRVIYGEKAFGGLTTGDYARTCDAALDEYWFFSGHTYHKDRSRLGKETLYFTIFREPTARVISLKQYWSTMKTELVGDCDVIMLDAMTVAREASIIEFLESDNPFIRQEITNGLIRQIIPLDILHNGFNADILANFSSELSSYHSVLTVERLAFSFPLMVAEFGFPAAPLGRENVSKACECSFEEVRQCLYRISPLDFAAYEIAKVIEAEQIKIRRYTHSAALSADFVGHSKSPPLAAI